MQALVVDEVSKAVWFEIAMVLRAQFELYNFPSELTQEFINDMYKAYVERQTDYHEDLWKALESLIKMVNERTEPRRTDNIILSKPEGKNVSGAYKHFRIDFKNINVAKGCTCLVTITHKNQRLFSSSIVLANERSHIQSLKKLSKILLLDNNEITFKLLSISQIFEKIIPKTTNNKAFNDRYKFTTLKGDTFKSITNNTKTPNTLISNENEKLRGNAPPFCPDTSVLGGIGGGILTRNPPVIFENDNSNVTTNNIVNQEKKDKNNENDNKTNNNGNAGTPPEPSDFVCTEEIHEENGEIPEEDYNRLKKQAGMMNSNLTFNIPHNLSWESTTDVMRQLYNDTGKLIFLVSNNKTIKGQLESQLGDGKKSIRLLATKYDEKTEDYTDLAMFTDSRPFTKIGKTYYSYYYTYYFRTDFGAKYYLLSKDKLEPQFCAIDGMFVNTSDLSVIGETRKFSIGLPLLFAQKVAPDIIAYTVEEYLDVVQKYNHNYLMEQLLGKLRHPTWFEKLNCAFLFSFEHGNYGLNIFMMARQGTGKSTYLDAFKRSINEDEIYSGTASTLKGLVPNFGLSPPSVGYIAKCRRIALIDEFLRILSKEKSLSGDADSVLGAMNDLLEHRARAFCSGKGNINVKAQARVLITTNPIHGMKTIVDLNAKQDAPMLSRFLLYAQNDVHVKFIQDKKQEIEQLGEAAYPMRSFELISMVDYLSRNYVKPPEGAVLELFGMFRARVPAPLLDTYDARYEHHITCLLDGLAKYHAVMRHDNNFIINDEVKKDCIEILGEIIASWIVETADLKSFDVSLRKYYIALEHRLIFDLIEGAKKITEANLRELLKEPQLKDLAANIMQLKNWQLIKQMNVGETAFLVPYWYDISRMAGATAEAPKDIMEHLREFIDARKDADGLVPTIDLEEKFGVKFIDDCLKDGVLFEPRPAFLKLL